MENKIARNPVGWFEIYVADIKRARKFYETVLNKSLEKLPVEMPDMEIWAFPGEMESPGASGALCQMKGVDPGNNAVLIYFSCADCAVEESRVAGAGGQVSKSKLSIGPYGYISLVVDTEGNMFGLHSMK